jgi:hypothetical protein
METLDRQGVVAGSGRWGAVVENASDLPVLDVRVHFFYVNDPRDGSPWTTDERYAAPERFRVIPPGQTRNLPLPYTQLGIQASNVSEQNFLIAIDFTDASGQQWYRDERAVLEPRGGRAAQAEEDIRRAGGSQVGASMMHGLG